MCKVQKKKKKILSPEKDNLGMKIRRLKSSRDYNEYMIS